MAIMKNTDLVVGAAGSNPILANQTDSVIIEHADKIKDFGYVTNILER